MGIALTKVVLAGGILAGGLGLGSLITYNGGEIIDNAKTKIAQQAEELNIFKSQQVGLSGKIVTLKERLAYLETNGTEKDQAEIATLKQTIADYEANAEAGGEKMAQRILDLEAEVNEANADSVELQASVDAAGDTKAMSSYQYDVLMDSTEGYSLFNMIFGTPQIVYDKDGNATALVIDKTSTGPDAELVIVNDTMNNYYYTLDNGTQILIATGSTVTIGKIADLDGSKMLVKDQWSNELSKLYLSAE